MGSISQLTEMLPSFSSFVPRNIGDDEEKQLKKIEAIILSMTPEERSNPRIIGGSRRRRIAKGSGTTPQDVNQLLNRFQQVQKVTKLISKGKLPKNLPFISDR